MFTMQSPTLAARFMYMTGTASDAELRAVADRMTVTGLGARMTMPSLVIAGEDDPLTDPSETFRHVDSIAGPKELLFYPAEDHAPLTRGSGQLITVDSAGRSHPEPWTPGLKHSYGAPLDARTLLTDDPGTGLQ